MLKAEEGKVLRMASHLPHMWSYVYIIQNLSGHYYVGLTDNLDERLTRHNKNEIISTAKRGPWKIVHFAAFESREKASAYERYLKSGSGTAFRQKRLV